MSTTSKANVIFTPLVRPWLDAVPDVKRARTFLREYKQYVAEVKHRKDRGEGTSIAEPIEFCLDPDLVEYLLEFEATVISRDASGKIKDSMLEAWLTACAGQRDERALEDILRPLRWWHAGSPFVEMQAQHFLMAAHRLVKDNDIVTNYGAKSLVKELGGKLPLRLAEAMRYELSLEVNQAKKKDFKLWGALLRERAKELDKMAKPEGNLDVETKLEPPRTEITHRHSHISTYFHSVLLRSRCMLVVVENNQRGY